MRSSTLIFNFKAYREADVVLGPHAVAVEPPKLISAGRTVSRPETVVKDCEARLCILPQRGHDNWHRD